MDQRKLFKYENILAVSGAAIIAFGAWNVVKAVIFFLVTPTDDLSQLYNSSEMAQFDAPELSEDNLDIIVLVIMLLALMISLLIRFLVGRAAIQDSRRTRRRGVTYIVFAVLMSLSLITSVFTRLYFNDESDVNWVQTYDITVVSTIVDLTSLMALVELIIAAIMVRRLRKKLEVA